MQNLQDARILVVGDVMLDEYWEGDTQRISPEAPVPVVHVQKQYFKAGGAANVALNIAALQGQVTLLGIVGDDHAADCLDGLLKKQKVNSQLLKIKGVPTIKKLRVLSQHQQLIRTDFEHSLKTVDKKFLLKSFKKLIHDVNVVVFSDYGKGTLSEVLELIKFARAEGKVVLVDPKSVDFSDYSGASLVTPNFKEFEAAVGGVQGEAEIVSKARMLLKKCDFDAVLVTRGAQGMSLVAHDIKPFHIPTKAREVFDVTGAGDTVIAVLAMAISVGFDLETSVNLANTAAGIVVGKIGTATVSPQELRAAILETDPMVEGVVSEAQLKKIVSAAQHRGEVVVMTNGCFDILHAGHVDYLNASKKLGSRLIVAVNSDASVSRLKGPERPINKLEQRMQVLAGLKAVDWVVPFVEDTPLRLISEILPDILVKAADYKVDEIVGASAVLANGGEVKTLPLVPGCSTTNIIKKIQKEG